MSPDKQGVKAYFAAFRRAVPDLHAQVHDMLADGDKVVTRAESARLPRRAHTPRPAARCPARLGDTVCLTAELPDRLIVDRGRYPGTVPSPTRATTSGGTRITAADLQSWASARHARAEPVEDQVLGRVGPGEQRQRAQHSGEHQVRGVGWRQRAITLAGVRAAPAAAGDGSVRKC